MSEQQRPYSFPSFRRLRDYLGETDALVELTELSARFFTSAAEVSGNPGHFVQTTAKLFNVIVNHTDFAELHSHLRRHNILTVYESAERFLHEFRREHVELYQKEWTGDSRDSDPLTVTLKNIGKNEVESAQVVGHDLISLFHYYRSVRNWVVHTKAKDGLDKSLASFKKIAAYSPENAEKYANSGAPNEPKLLNFQDFVLFSRITKHLAERICRVTMPPVEVWTKSLDAEKKRFMRLSMNPERMRRAVVAWLRTEYAMEIEIAQGIVDELNWFD